MKGMFLHTLSILRNLQFALLMVVIVLCLHFDTQVARISTICCSISYQIKTNNWCIDRWYYLLDLKWMLLYVKGMLVN